MDGRVYAMAGRRCVAGWRVLRVLGLVPLVGVKCLVNRAAEKAGECPRKRLLYSRFCRRRGNRMPLGVTPSLTGTGKQPILRRIFQYNPAWWYRRGPSLLLIHYISKHILSTCAVNCGSTLNTPHFRRSRSVTRTTSPSQGQTFSRSFWLQTRNMLFNFVMTCWLVIGKMLSGKGYLICLILLPCKSFPIHDAFDVTTSNNLVSMRFSNFPHQSRNRTSVKHSNAVARLGEPREQSEAACCCSPQRFERRSITETVCLKCEIRI